MNKNYDDIINLPHHVSSARPHMSAIDRAAQFSPFAALTGYDAAVKETARLTDEKIELDEEALAILNKKLQMLVECLDKQPEVTISFFKEDEKKSGGAYLTITGIIKKIDNFERAIILHDGTVIPMDDVLDIISDRKELIECMP